MATICDMATICTLALICAIMGFGFWASDEDIPTEACVMGAIFGFVALMSLFGDTITHEVQSLKCAVVCSHER